MDQGTFMTAYTIKEVSKKIEVPEGTIRQWEKDFQGLLIIPRDGNNARYYTDFEIETIKHIKTMREKNLSKDLIREMLSKRAEDEVTLGAMIQPPIPQMSQNEALETLRNIQRVFETIPEMKGLLIKELKEEFRNELKDALIDEVKKELASSSEEQQKLLESNNSKTSEQLETISSELLEMKNNYESEVKRRDEALTENIRLMRELREEKSGGFFKKLFGK